jgi:hypothetical protein
MKRLFLIGMLLAPAALRAGDKSLVYLYDVRSNHAEPERSERLANRLYVKYEPAWKRWVMVLTDDKGKFPAPTAALMPDSVLKGSRLGDTDDHRYLLNRESQWVPTEKKGFPSRGLVATHPIWRRLGWRARSSHFFRVSIPSCMISPLSSCCKER